MAIDKTSTIRVIGQPRSYESVEIALTFEFEEGDFTQDVIENKAALLNARLFEAIADNRRQRDEMEERERKRQEDEYKAQRQRDLDERPEKWAVTPAMVASKSTLRDKAFEAARIDAEHSGSVAASQAHQKALELFGLDITFQTANGKTFGVYEGVTFEWSLGYFATSVVINGKPVSLGFTETLEKLGRMWQVAEGKTLAAALRVAEPEVDDSEDDEDDEV